MDINKDRQVGKQIDTNRQKMIYKWVQLNGQTEDRHVAR